MKKIIKRAPFDYDYGKIPAGKYKKKIVNRIFYMTMNGYRKKRLKRYENKIIEAIEPFTEELTDFISILKAALNE